MKKTIRLSESDLIRLVKRVIKEQDNRSIQSEAKNSNDSINETINIDSKGDNKPSMSLINKKINGVDTTMVKVKDYFYHNGVIQDKKFLMKLQNGFAKVWDDLTSNN
jgi:molybdopterin-biosynthesis enzyme MoeA-like protein